MSSVRLCRQPPPAVASFSFSVSIDIALSVSVSLPISGPGPGPFPFFSWIGRRPGPSASAFFGFSSFPSFHAAFSPCSIPSLFFQSHEQLEHGQRRPRLVFDDELVEVRFFPVQFSQQFVGAVGSFGRSVRCISEPHPPRSFQVSASTCVSLFHRRVLDLLLSFVASFAPVLQPPTGHRGGVQRLGRVPSVRHAVPGQRRRHPVSPRISAVRFHRHHIRCTSRHVSLLSSHPLHNPLHNPFPNNFTTPFTTRLSVPPHLRPRWRGVDPKDGRGVGRGKGETLPPPSWLLLLEPKQ